MHPFEQPIFGALLDEAMEAEVGQLRGPVRVKDGYSVFKVVEKVGQKPEPFEKAVSRARYWLKKEEESRLSEELILKLRKDYASQVVVFEDRLKVMDEK
jgi:parvulin-like peptidyl-prolyl isomerase